MKKQDSPDNKTGSPGIASKDSSQSPVIPRDAASVLVYRGDINNPEVLLGRRPKGSKFMPDVFVYPGGAVDPSDADIQAATTLADDIVQRINQSADTNRATALAVAAVREMFEETGFLLASPGNPGHADDDTWDQFRKLGLAPNLAPLRYLGRAITPPIRPRRFHARFFAIDQGHLSGELRETEELVDLGWFCAKMTGDLPMADVTRYMLELLLDMLESNEDDWLGHRVFTHKNGRRSITSDAP